MDKTLEAKLFAEYTSINEQLKSFLINLSSQVESVLRNNDISLGSAIEYRVKEFDSLIDKFDRLSIKSNSVFDLNDVLGIRIILLFLPELDQVDKLLAKYFTIKKSEDTETRLSESEFGYRSRHYQVTLSDEWLNIPTLSKCEDLQVEIQVRTMSQNIWAVASHKLQYKSNSDVPIELRRSINRLAALLETVDLEFERIVRKRSTYFNSVFDMDKLLKQPINSDSMMQYCKKKFPDYEISPQWQEILLSDIDIEKYSNIEKIDRVIWEAQPAVSEYEKRQPSLFRYSTDFITKSLGFVDKNFRNKHPFGKETLLAFDNYKQLLQKFVYHKGQERQPDVDLT